METSVNNKCRAFTSLEQSKKLAEILPLESADMYYSPVPVREWKDKEDTSKGTHVVFKDQIFAIENLRNHKIGEGDIYSWSLSALLGVIPNYKLSSEHNYHTCTAEIFFGKETVAWFDNPVDACVAMIEKLHELNLL